MNEVGAWSWTELVTPDLDAATEFYTGMFGWEGIDESGGIGRVTFQVGRLLIAGAHEPTGFEQGWGPTWIVSFVVDDTDAAVARTEELSGSVLLPGLDVPVGRLAIVADPQGAPFMVAQVPGGALRGLDGS